MLNILICLREAIEERKAQKLLSRAEAELIHAQGATRRTDWETSFPLRTELLLFLLEAHIGDTRVTRLFEELAFDWQCEVSSTSYDLSRFVLVIQAPTRHRWRKAFIVVRGYWDFSRSTIKSALWRLVEEVCIIVLEDQSNYSVAEIALAKEIRQQLL